MVGLSFNLTRLAWRSVALADFFRFVTPGFSHTPSPTHYSPHPPFPPFHNILQASGPLDSIREVFREVPRVVSGAYIPSTGHLTGRVTFSSVRFSYPTRPDAAVLSGLDADIAPGSIVAIVGPSGAGKPLAENTPSDTSVCSA